MLYRIRTHTLSVMKVNFIELLPSGLTILNGEASFLFFYLQLHLHQLAQLDTTLDNLSTKIFCSLTFICVCVYVCVCVRACLYVYVWACVCVCVWMLMVMLLWIYCDFVCLFVCLYVVLCFLLYELVCVDTLCSYLL